MNAANRLQVPYRLIGGNCVTLLIAVHKVVGVPPRDTADVDLGATRSSWTWTCA